MPRELPPGTAEETLAEDPFTWEKLTKGTQGAPVSEHRAKPLARESPVVGPGSATGGRRRTLAGSVAASACGFGVRRPFSGLLEGSSVMLGQPIATSHDEPQGNRSLGDRLASIWKGSR